MITYEVKIKGFKENEDGVMSMAAKKYIVTQAITCGQAENIVIYDAAAYMKDEITCTSVQQKSLSHIINPEGDRMWYVKIQMDYIDPLTDKEKKQSYLYLIGAESAKQASDILMQHLEDIRMDKEIVKISDSKVDFVISAE